MSSPVDDDDMMATMSVASKEPEPEAEPVKAQSQPEKEEPFPLADPGEYYIGLWSGIPNFGCPYCGFATLQGSGAVEIHVLERIEQGNARHMEALKHNEGGPA